MRISDWSSDVCSSDLPVTGAFRSGVGRHGQWRQRSAWADRSRGDRALLHHAGQWLLRSVHPLAYRRDGQGHSERQGAGRSEEHTSELQSLMRISYAVFCLNKKITKKLMMSLTEQQRLTRH